MVTRWRRKYSSKMFCTPFEITPLYNHRVYFCAVIYVVIALLPPPRRLCFRRCLSVCLLAILCKNFERICLEILGKVGIGPVNNRLNFGGYPDHCLDTGIVFRILLRDRESWTALQLWRHFITSPVHDSATATALHAACSVTGARYRDTGETELDGGTHCPSASSILVYFQSAFSTP